MYHSAKLVTPMRFVETAPPRRAQPAHIDSMENRYWNSAPDSPRLQGARNAAQQNRGEYKFKSLYSPAAAAACAAMSATNAADSAKYSVRANAACRSRTHPLSYPGAAHFSG